MLHRPGGAFGEDGIAAGDMDRIYTAMGIDDDVQADHSTDVSALQVRGVVGVNLRDQLSRGQVIFGLLGVCARARRQQEQKGQKQAEGRNTGALP